MKTTFGRNFLTYTLILLVALLITGVSFNFMVQEHLANNAIDSLKSDSSAISDVAATYLSTPGLDPNDFMLTLSVAAEIAGSDAIICDQNGVLLMCSASPMDCEHKGMQLSNPDYIRKLQEHEYVVSTGYVENLYDDERYVVSTPIRHETDKTLLGFVMVSTPTTATYVLLDQLSQLYLLISVLVLLVAMSLMIYYARKTTNPLRTIAKTATAFGHGDLKARVTVPRKAPREIQEVAVSFNNMANSLEKSENQHRDFVASVSHELKTPMTSISGYVDGILDGTIPPEQQEKYLHLVSNETKRLNRLVRSMLDIAQLHEQGIPESRKINFDIAECAGQVLISFEQKITAKELEVDVSLPDFPTFTFADRDAITQVIYNLTDNAVKFCPDGGKLGLRISTEGHKHYITVSNTGPTIPPEELPMLFERFHKLDRSRSMNRDSWGLGLYIVKTIVCGHGEDISVTSRNDYTEFTFTLPVIH